MLVRRSFSWVGLSVLMLWLAVLSAPTTVAASQTISIEAGTRLDGSMYFTPNVPKVQKGDSVTITVTNRDTNGDGSVATPHDLAIFGFGPKEPEGEAGACPAATEHEGPKQAFEVCNTATATHTFTADTPGVYAFICEVPGHAEKGMTGTFVVEGAPAPALGIGSNVGWLKVLVVALVPMVIGFAWYSPMLFAKPWMASLGLKESDMPRLKREAPKAYAWSLLGALLSSFALWQLVRWSGAFDWWEGALVGALVWLGFSMTVLMGISLFEGRSWRLFNIAAGYQLVNLLVMGSIFAAWG